MTFFSMSRESPIFPDAHRGNRKETRFSGVFSGVGPSGAAAGAAAAAAGAAAGTSRPGENVEQDFAPQKWCFLP